MPKEITHILNAWNIVKGLDPAMQNIVNRYKQAYNYGSVAPDTFYYDTVSFGWKQNILAGLPWGNAIHGSDGNDSMSVIKSMSTILQNFEHYNQFLQYDNKDECKKICTSFALGYITHACLDIKMHPIIFYFAGDHESKNKQTRKKAETLHRTIETLLDLFILDKKKLSFSNTSLPKIFLLPKEEEQIVLKFFCLTLRLSFGNELKPQVRDTLDLKYQELIANDLLFETTKRSYKKQCVVTSLFQKKIIKNILRLYNGKTEKIASTNSLFYPCESYSQYLHSHAKINFLELKSYIDPFTGTTKALNIDQFINEIQVFTVDFIQTFLNDASKLPRVKMTTGAYKNSEPNPSYCKPLTINSNFE